MKYTFDVKFTGYEQITVEADSLEEAEQKLSIDLKVTTPLRQRGTYAASHKNCSCSVARKNEMDDTDSKQMLTFFDELQQEPSAELKQAMAVLVVASGERLEKKLAAQRAANAPLPNAVIARAEQLGVEVHDIRLSPVDPADLKGPVSVKSRP